MIPHAAVGEDFEVDAAGALVVVTLHTTVPLTTATLLAAKKFFVRCVLLDLSVVIPKMIFEQAE